MPFRPFDRAKFAIERWLVRGAFHRALLAALLVGLISVLGGMLAVVFGSGFGELSDAVWWSFLRLSDPGYLGDDEGAVNRTVSTVLTVLGYVVFLGALVAIMTQWLNARMAKLESGLTPVVRDGHILILGWTNRTDAIVRELLFSQERARRFLNRRGGHSLHIVLLVPTVTADFVQNLRDAVGPVWDENRVTVRSGSALRPEHLERVDATHAAVILIPGADFDEGSAQSDAQTIKTLLSLEVMSAAARQRPRVVAEIYEARKVHLARRAYRSDIEVVSSDVVVSRLLAQNIRHSGLSRVYDEILTHREGSEIYIREADALTGLEVEELHRRFPRGVLMGLVRRSADGVFTPLLNPPAGIRVKDDDRLVVLARCYEDSMPSELPTQERFRRAAPSGKSKAERSDLRRVLILGWNHRVPALLTEFGTYEHERYEVRIGSKIPVARREELLAHLPTDTDSLRVEHLEVDLTDPDDTEIIAPERADSILLMGSDWMESAEEADARTLMGSLIVDERLGAMGRDPTVILELLDADNAGLVTRTRGELIISPLVLSHLMTQIALRPELQSVFDELFTVSGAEIAFHSVSRYTKSHRFSFEDLQRGAAALGETALGVRQRQTGELLLNPSREDRWGQTAGLDLVALITLASEKSASQ